MTNQRLVAIGYIVLALLAGFFFEHVLLAAFGTFGITQPLTRPLTGEWTWSSLIGLLLAFGIAFYLWATPRYREVSFEIAAELRKVSWPGLAETRAATIAVIVASLIAAALLGYSTSSGSSSPTRSRTRRCEGNPSDARPGDREDREEMVRRAHVFGLREQGEEVARGEDQAERSRRILRRHPHPHGERGGDGEGGKTRLEAQVLPWLHPRADGAQRPDLAPRQEHAEDHRIRRQCHQASSGERARDRPAHHPAF